ncbi:hypothetical protein CAPTEDRAFT_67305, partial [Capitella teleta]
KGLTEIPDDIPLDVTSINLEENSISTIGPAAFSKFTQLNSLDISFNRIGIIHEDAFAGLKNLGRLILFANKIKEIPKLQGLALSELNLHNNSIALIKDGDFHDNLVSPLLYLELAGNMFECDCRVSW